MRKSCIKLFSAAVLLAFFLAGLDVQAQKKSKNHHILDGSQVYLSQIEPAKPVEEKLKANSKIGLEYNPTKTVYLYPYGQDQDQGIVEDGVRITEGPLESNELEGPEIAENGGFIANVTDSARIDIYLPEHPNGQMVIACPGGGYHNLSSWNEGIYVAKWMNDRGIACAVAKYRLPNGHPKVPLQDIQNAFRYCRHHAAEWGVNQVGVIGFSAGGHLASMVETQYVDSITKPDFAVLIYPVISMAEKVTHHGSKDNLIGDPATMVDRDVYTFDEWYDLRKDLEAREEKYSSNLNVTTQTPPTFIALSSDDKTVAPENSLRFYSMMIHMRQDPEMHIYPYGGHGWGFTDQYLGLSSGTDNLKGCRHEFSVALERWLAERRLTNDRTSSPDREQFSIKPDKVVYLYPKGQGVDEGIPGITLGPGESNGFDRPEEIGKNENHYFTGDSARFELYFAKNPNGKLVIITPGGSYKYTAGLTEGKMAAKWLNERGISAAVLYYRLPNHHWNVPLTDVQNTFRYCRHFAKEWGIKQIGIMGFSAGGHLAATASTLYVDEVTRPDFSILVYPVISMEEGVGHKESIENLLGPKSSWADRKTAKDTSSSYVSWHVRTDMYKGLLEKYSLDKQVSTDTPPTFIIYSSNDGGVPPENELRYFRALLRCKVPCELHALPAGGHGYGFKDAKYVRDPLNYLDRYESDYREDFYNSIERFLNER